MKKRESANQRTRSIQALSAFLKRIEAAALTSGNPLEKKAIGSADASFEKKRESVNQRTKLFQTLSAFLKRIEATAQTRALKIKLFFLSELSLLNEVQITVKKKL